MNSELEPLYDILDRLQSNNDPPTEEELEILRKGHPIHLRRRDALEDQIRTASPRERIRLEGDAYRLRGVEKKIKAALSPFRRLPTEIISKILEESVPVVLTRPWRKMLLKMCRVSKRWRDIILSTPSLWASIYLHVEMPSRTSHEQTNVYSPCLPARVRAWFNRARNARLTFILTASEDQPWSDEAFQAISDIILITAEDRNWHKVRFDFKTPPFQRMLRDLGNAVKHAPHNPWKALALLAVPTGASSLGWGQDEQGAPFTGRGELDTHAPKIEELQLTMLSSLSQAAASSFSHRHLRHLTISIELLVLSSAFGILAFLPNLRTLEMSEGYYFSRPRLASFASHATESPVIHNGIRELIIHDDMEISLRYLTLPHLEHLEMCQRDRMSIPDFPYNGDVDVDMLGDFLSRSGCPLRVLHLGRPGISSGCLNSLLRKTLSRLDTLEDLILPSHIHFVKHLIHDWTRQSSQGLNLNRLHYSIGPYLLDPFSFPAHQQANEFNEKVIDPVLLRSIKRIHLTGESRDFSLKHLVRWLEERRLRLDARVKEGGHDKPPANPIELHLDHWRVARPFDQDPVLNHVRESELMVLRCLADVQNEHGLRKRYSLADETELEHAAESDDDYCKDSMTLAQHLRKRQIQMEKARANRRKKQADQAHAKNLKKLSKLGLHLVVGGLSQN